MTEQKEKWNLKPIIGLAVISLLICGLFYPFLMTGLAKFSFPTKLTATSSNLKVKQSDQIL